MSGPIFSLVEVACRSEVVTMLSGQDIAKVRIGFGEDFNPLIKNITWFNIKAQGS